MRPWRAVGGRFRQANPPSPAAPLPPLEPADLPPAPSMDLKDPTKVVVQRMLKTYFNLTQGRGSTKSVTGVEAWKRWEKPLNALVHELRRAGCSPSGYVHYVVERTTLKRGTPPYAAEVFGVNAVKSWLPQYLRVGILQVMPPSTYVSTPDRTRIHLERERNHGGPLPIRPGGTTGDGASDIGRSNDAPQGGCEPEPRKIPG